MMKRWAWILPVAILVIAVAGSPGWGYYQAGDNPERPDVEHGVKDPVGYATFAAECEDVFNTVKTTLDTYVGAVVTVVKAVMKAVVTVFVSVVKFAVRFALTLAMALAQWLLSVVF
jgi:hypothetical protein